MLQIALIRHAKAVAHTDAARDHARTLDGRGRDDAEALGRRLVQLGLRPDLVLCSTAQRTAQTFVHINGAFEPPLRLVEEPMIYEASADAILGLVRGTPADVRFLALVGHNPGFENAVGMLLDGESQATWRARGDSMPTGCAVVMEGDAADWSSIALGSLRLLHVLSPGDKAG